MSTASRVTVVNGARRVDLALPTVLPLADVIPQLLRFCSPEEDPERPAAWTLARVGGPSLSLGHSLADAGVLDGEVLELRSVEVAAEPAYVEDVRDAIEDVVDESGGQWRSRTTVGFLLTVAAAAAGAAVLLPFTRTPGDPRALAAAVLLAGLGTAGGWWGTGRAHPAAAQAALTAGCVWGGVAGWLAGTSAGWPPTAALAAGVVAALLVAVVGRLLTPLATPHLAGLGVLAGAAGVAAVLGRDPSTTARVLGVLAVLAIGVLPRVAVSAGGLATADYRVRTAGLMTQEDLADRVRLGSGLLLGGIVGAAAVGALAGVQLAYAGSLWDRLLSVCLGLGLLLRSRVFSRILHMAPLRLAGTAVLVAHGIRLGSLPDVRPWSTVLVALLGTGLVALGAAPLSEISRARVKHALNWAESAVVIAMITLAAAGLGLYAMVADVAG